MHNVNHFRQYATALGLSLVLLVVCLYGAGILVDEVCAEAAPALCTPLDEVPFLTITADSALLPATTPLQGSLSRWPASNEAFVPCPLSLRAHSPVSRAPPGV
jgi:hypothetical protein